MASKNSFRSTSLVETILELDVHEVTDDMFAFRKVARHRLVEKSGDTCGPLPKDSDVQGIVNAKNLKALVDGKDYKGMSGWYVIDDSVREFVRRQSRRIACHDKEAEERFVAGLRTDFYDAFATEGRPREDLARFDGTCDLWFDASGRPLPSAIYFGDFNGRVHADRFDLQALAEHLLTRDDVVLFGCPKDYPRRFDAKTVAVDAVSAVFPPAGYEGSRGTVHAVWQPSPEDSKLMWDWCKANSKKEGRLSDEQHEAVFALDLLGYRASGACRVEKYWDSIEVEDDKEDDECSGLTM